MRGYSRAGDPVERIVRMVSANAVVIFSRSSCCLCHAVKRLLLGMGVNSTVYEAKSWRGRWCGSSALPLVFVGGKLVGGIEGVLASHINGTLVPLLKDAGALWL